MRSFLIVLATAIAAAGSFAVYWRLQPKPPAAVAATAPAIASKPAPGPTFNNVGAGRLPWINTYDNGRLTSQFTADDFVPQPDHSVKVSHPIVLMHRGRHEIIKLTGTDGVLDAVPGGAAKAGGAMAGTMEASRDGRMNNVVIQFLPTETSTVPTQTIWTDNVRYKSDLLQLFTERCVDAAGNQVPADRVPVRVRGDQYDFDGAGLTIRWNGATHRVQLLEIAHGGSLVIKNTKELAMPGGRATAEMPEMLASSDPAGVELLLAKAADPIYHRAVFQNDVKIYQGDRLSGACDRMTVDFVDASSEKQAPAAVAVYDVRPEPMGQPEAVPEKAPVTIRWTGKLQITELQVEPMMPLDVGQSVVRMEGSPVRLTPVGLKVTAAVAMYRSGDEAFVATSSAAVPEVVLARDNGFTLHARGVANDPVTSVATIDGPSELDVPQKVGKPLVVRWRGRGFMHTVGTGSAVDGVDRVDLSNQVSVVHPTFNMTARTLRLDLGPSPKRAKTDDGPTEVPRHMAAAGDVRCRFVNKTGQTQGIDADKLDVGLVANSAGQAVPRSVAAAGHVRASDADQTMTAERLIATLAEKPSAARPTGDDAAGSVDLVDMEAEGGVHVATKTGAIAESRQMRVSTVNGARQVEMWGDGGATVNDGKGKTIIGSVLHLAPDRNAASVDGAGTIHSTPGPESAAATGRPFDVSWTDSMSIDSAQNDVEVVGRVVVRTVDSRGGTDFFTGDQAHIELEGNPGKKPVTGDNGDKQVRRVVMAGHVTGESLLVVDGIEARRAKMDDVDELDYTADDGRITVPGHGRLLIETHKAAGVKAEAGNKGAMAVRWKDSLVYDDAAQTIDIKGGVRTAFAPDASPDRPADVMRLDSTELVITMKKKADPAVKGGQESVSDILATGAVHFTARGAVVDCHTADFNPETQRMIARASDTEPGKAANADGTAVGTFDGSFQELTFDTASQEVVSVKGVGGTIRK